MKQRPDTEHGLQTTRPRWLWLQQQLFRTITFSTFWCQQMVTYPANAKEAQQIFIPVVTTHLCEQSFSRMLDIKMKKRNKLRCEYDMRVVLAKVKPRISELVPGRQQQKSHRFAANIHYYIFCLNIMF
ncbi:hypothetical protein FHG87_022845 [Trinorchestia longiramus]|nr:hypothetical protein FHG87_022845 [Trinorchestia longiramus]